MKVKQHRKKRKMKKQMMIVNLVDKNGTVIDRQTFKNLRDMELWLNEAYPTWQEKNYAFEIFYK